MSTVVSRTCTELHDADSGDNEARLLAEESNPLSEYRSAAAYVLLGDPGAGKTTEFEQEREQLGEAALLVSARDFVTLNLASRPEWRDRVLFIDGLDEMRAGRSDSRVPLDAIRNRLDHLRRPWFRLSCREADWLGHSDRHSLKAVSPDSSITVLRLDPLSEPSAITLLESKHSVPEGREFMAEAHRLGLSGMLGNPLTLGLLADAVVEGGAWPETRLETFEAACRKMASEANPEHLAGAGARPTSTVLDAAGYLCALQLLSGEAGYSLPTSVAAPASVALAELGEAPGGLSLDDLTHTLGTNLFMTVVEGVRAPKHRQVAEFLAGRHLARLIDDGLPARRVVALMVGTTDDRVVTSLRGLSAWLAAHSREARPTLIDADPVGMALYGDIGALNTREKEHLVESLSVFAAEASLFDHQRRDGRSYGYRDDTAWTFRSLATADMVPTMSKLLSRAAPDTAEGRLGMLILGALSHTDDPESIASLQGAVEAILFNNAWTPAIRQQALDAYLHFVPRSDDRTEVLKRLLDAVQDGSVPDPDDQVRGTLLEILYPDEIAPSEVWRYAVPRNHDCFGSFWIFWNQTLLDKSSGQLLVELLDSLHEDASRLVPRPEQPDLETLTVELLARCMEAVGDAQEPARLYGWLATACGLSRRPQRRDEPMRRVRAWLEARPHIQKEIVLTWLRRRHLDDSGRASDHWFCKALHGSALPPDYGLWCLDRAVQIGDAEPEVSEGLLSEAYRSLHKPSRSVGLTLDAMRERTRGHPVLARHLNEFEHHASSESSTEDEFQRELEELQREQGEKRRQRRADWAKHLEEHEAELWENRFPPRYLQTLAVVYLGLNREVDRRASPRDRISDFFGGDPRQVDAVTAALREAVSREDVPDVGQTVSWSLESKHSLLAYPVLASLDLLDKENSARLDALPEAQKRAALAVYYCVTHGGEAAPWHYRWLRQDPELVLDVLYRCAVADVRAGKEIPSGLNELDRADGLDDRVHETRLRLLEAFPTRSSNQQLAVLDRLLAKALSHPANAALLDLAVQKQQARSMPVAQRIRWWATDALVAQGTRLHQLKSDLSKSEVRIRHLAEFLSSISWERRDLETASELAVTDDGTFSSKPVGHGRGQRVSILATIRDPATLQTMVEVLGHWFAARTHVTGTFTYTLELHMSDLVGSLISQLGSQPGREARQALTCLVENPELESWHPRLSWALEEQRVIHRDASYRHPTIEQVQETLCGGSPANAGDLAALLVDRLDDIRDELRGGSSDPWRPFWNEDGHRRPTTAKPEDSCRDALLDKLRPTLPDGVEAVREGSYAADTRADIRVSCRGFNVPVEIKKDSHSDLWKAMRDQLMAQYTKDSATEGHGIYLVLWFAADGKPVTRHPDSGRRPSTPEELKEWLEADLTPEEARKISVVVLDVTKLGTNSTGARRGLATANRRRRALERESAAASSG